MPNKYQTFETQRLLLTPTTEKDSEFIVELLNTPKWLEYIGDRKIYSVEDACQYIAEKMTPQFERLGFGNYTITRKSDGIIIGSCGLYDREGVDGIDIGFGFLPEYEKKGYALEASLKVKEIAFNNFNLDKISAITSKKNIGSQTLLKKLGLQYIENFKLPDSNESLMLYQLDK